MYQEQCSNYQIKGIQVYTYLEICMVWVLGCEGSDDVHIWRSRTPGTPAI